jgi:hypothetical protein
MVDGTVVDGTVVDGTVVDGMVVLVHVVIDDENAMTEIVVVVNLLLCLFLMNRIYCFSLKNS